MLDRMDAQAKKTAFVFGGGGARGALQVGALQALLEAGIYPQLLVGTSIGAIHAAYLAINGVTLDSVQALKENWLKVSRRDLLPTNPLRLAGSLFSNGKNTPSFKQMRELLVKFGFDPQVRFEDIRRTELVLMTTDLASGSPTLFGNHVPGSAEERILDAVLASACLPPWMRPVRLNGKYLVDGGIVSELPVETAVNFNATEIYAFDVSRSPKGDADLEGWSALLESIINSSKYREKQLELSLARAKGIDVRLIPLTGSQAISTVDFHASHKLMARGYEITRAELARWQPQVNP